MAQGLLATRKRRIVGWREPLPGHGPSGPGFGGGGPRGKRRTGEWRSRHPGSRLGGGGGIMALALFRRRLEGFGRPARLRGSSAKGRRSLPARERRSGSGLAGLLSGSFAPARQALQAYAVELAFGLALPVAPGAGAEGYGCWFARARRAGTRPRKGPPVLSRSAPYRQVRRHRPRSGDLLPRGLRAAEPATAHEASGRALPRARGSGHPPPAPGASFYLGIRSNAWPEEGCPSSWRFN